MRLGVEAALVDGTLVPGDVAVDGGVITAVGPRARFKAPRLGTRHHRGLGHERDSTGAACAHADTAVPAMSATQRSAMPTALTAVPAMSAIPGVRLGLRRRRVQAVRRVPDHELLAIMDTTLPRAPGHHGRLVMSLADRFFAAYAAALRRVVRW